MVRDFSLYFLQIEVRRVRVSLPNSRQRRGNVGGDEQLSFGGGGEGELAELSTTDGVTHYSYGEGFLAHLP